MTRDLWSGLTVHDTHIHKCQVGFEVLGEAKGVITLIDPDDCLELPQDLLQAAYGLTPAEARVAQRVACGENPEEIADRHQVSPGTVRMQLKSIFQKTNTKRQAQLVSLLARLGRIR